MLPIVFSNDLEIDKEPHVQSIQNKPQELRVYSRRVGQPQKQQKLVIIPEYCQEPVPEVNTQMNEASSGLEETVEEETQSEEQEQLISDLNVPIALRKGTRTYTQHSFLQLHVIQSSITGVSSCDREDFCRRGTQKYS